MNNTSDSTCVNSSTNNPLCLVNSNIKDKSIIYSIPKNNQYLYSQTTSIDDLSSHKTHISIPLVVDTEFTGKQREGVTVQSKAIFEPEGIIYTHKDLQQYALERGLTNKLRHRPITFDFAPLQHLVTHGYDVEFQIYDRIHQEDLHGNRLNYCQFDIFSHFSLAELMMIFTGDARKKIVDIIRYGKYRIIEMTRRLRTYTRSNKGLQVSDNIELPFHVVINNNRYRVKLRIIDTCALHGIASYKNLASATGVKLEYKDILSQYDLENFRDTYFNKPVESDNYSLGDLSVYDILTNNSKLFKKVYKSLDVEQYFQAPKLTIGSTVRNVFKAVLDKELKIDTKEKSERLKDFLSYGSSSNLKKETNTTRCLLAKVFGGRCRNNRPTDIGLLSSKPDLLVRSELYQRVKSHIDNDKLLGKNIKFIIDNDIAGCYGNGLRNQIYPVGKPIIEDYKLSKFNKYSTLREWLKQRKYGKKDCELVDGLWTAIVSTKEIDPDTNQWEKLKYPQDFLPSWFNFKYSEVSNMATDTDKADVEIKPKTGTVKILNYQVINSVITSDFLEWLFNVCSPKQRNEILDNLYIKTACFYPSYSRVDTFDELLEIWEYWNEGNTTRSEQQQVKVKKKTLSTGVIVSITKEPSFWVGLDLGKLIIDDLLAWRALHKKLDGKKSPMDVLFKLCTNTLYGDFTSPYFDISNTVVGNNITARCRAMAWYMEKGHYAFQTITDGGQIDPNKVCYPKSEKRKVTALGVTNLYRVNPVKNNVILKPLAGYDAIEAFSTNEKWKLRLVKEKSEEIIDNALSWLETKLFEHLQNIFPNVSVLHKETTSLVVDISEDKTPIKNYVKQKGMFHFEIKDIYTKALFHGTSNYLLDNENIKTAKIAMRSYENKRKHISFELIETGDVVDTTLYDGLSPSNYFLEKLDSPSKITRSKVFKKNGILKLNDWKNNIDKWLDKGYFCGDTIEKVGLLREFSISQFTYQTIDQYLSIEKEVQSNKCKYNQSYEGYFINDDGTLNYQLMIETIDKIIASGCLSINKVLDKDRHRNRDINISHPQAKVYDVVREQVNQGLKIDIYDDYYEDDDVNIPTVYEGNLEDINL